MVGLSSKCCRQRARRSAPPKPYPRALSAHCGRALVLQRRSRCAITRPQPAAHSQVTQRILSQVKAAERHVLSKSGVQVRCAAALHGAAFGSAPHIDGSDRRLERSNRNTRHSHPRRRRPHRRQHTLFTQVRPTSSSRSSAASIWQQPWRRHSARRPCPARVAGAPRRSRVPAERSARRVPLSL